MGTITLAAPAPAGGATVTLSAGAEPRTLIMPDRVTVPPGASEATFTASVGDLTRLCPSWDPDCGYTAEITARLSATRVTHLGISRSCTILPGGELGLAAPAEPLVSGREATGTVSPAKPAPNDIVIELQSSDSAVLALPDRVEIRRGASSTTFVMRPAPVVKRTRVRISASAGRMRRHIDVDVVPTLIDQLEMPAEVTAGELSEVTVVLTEPAPVGGTAVVLSVDGSEPVTTIIEAGARRTTIELQMPAVAADEVATVTAAAYDVERRTSTRLKPAVAELVALEILPPPSGSGALVCKGVGTGGIPIPGSKHCRIRVTCEQCNAPPIDVTVGMEFTGNPPYSMNEWPYPQGLQTYDTTIPIGVDGKKECDFAKCIRAYNKLYGKGYTGQGTKWVPKYSIPGPNSNTYAQQLLTACDGWTVFPPGAIGSGGYPGTPTWGY